MKMNELVRFHGDSLLGTTTEFTIDKLSTVTSYCPGKALLDIIQCSKLGSEGSESIFGNLACWRSQRTMNQVQVCLPCLLAADQIIFTSGQP